MFIDFPFLVTHHYVRWRTDSTPTTTTTSQAPEPNQSGDSESKPETGRAASMLYIYVIAQICIAWAEHYFNRPLMYTHAIVDWQNTDREQCGPFLDFSFTCYFISEPWPAPLRELNYNKQDFPGKAHCLCRWFGLTNFVVITPKSYALTHESRIKTVLSAITLAIQNSSWWVMFSLMQH